MKISAKTLSAARKAAAKQNMTLDDWANEVLAAAAAPNRLAGMEAMLADISRKIDDLVERKSFGENANEHLSGAVSEIGSSLKQASMTTGMAFDKVRTKAGIAVGEIADKALEVIGQLNKPVIEPAVQTAPPAEARAKTRAKPKAAPRSKGVASSAPKRRQTKTRAKKPTTVK